MLITKDNGACYSGPFSRTTSSNPVDSDRDMVPAEAPRSSYFECMQPESIDRKASACVRDLMQYECYGSTSESLAHEALADSEMMYKEAVDLFTQAQSRKSRLSGNERHSLFYPHTGEVIAKFMESQADEQLLQGRKALQEIELLRLQAHRILNPREPSEYYFEAKNTSIFATLKLEILRIYMRHLRLQQPGPKEHID